MRLQNKNNLLNFSSSLFTLASNFFLNFIRLILRSLVLRSLTCVLFYLLFGIDTAYAWVDHTGNTRNPTSPKIIRTINSIWNELTGETTHDASDRFNEYEQVASYSNNREEWERNWKAHHENFRRPPNIPTEDPSNNPTRIPTINAIEIPEEPDWNPYTIYEDNPPKWEPYCKELSSNGGVNNVSKEQLYNLRKKYWVPLNYDNLLPYQSRNDGFNPDYREDAALARRASRLNIWEGRHLDINLKENKEQIPDEKQSPNLNLANLQKLLADLPPVPGSTASNPAPDSTVNNTPNTPHSIPQSTPTNIAPKVTPPPANSVGNTVLSINRTVTPTPNVPSPSAVPPLPTPVSPPVLNNPNPQPVVPVSTPSESWYSGVLDSVCDKISNFTSVFSYLTGSRDIGSNLRNNVEGVIPSKTSVLTSVAISATGICIHFLVNTYMGTTTGAFIRNVPGMIKREDLADWYLDNPMSLLNNPWDKLKYIWKQPVEMNTVLDHFNGDYWAFAAPGIKAIAPLVFPALDHSILAGFPLIGGIAQATGMSPSRVVSIGAIAATQALATATGTTFSGAVSNMFARLTAVNMSVFSAIGSSISWAWSKLSVVAVKQAASVLKGSGNLVVNGLQAAGIISAQTAAQINNFRNSTNKKIQDWLLGSGGSALFGKLFGSEGSKLHSRFEKLLKKLDGDFPWLEFLIFITMGLYLLRILWSFRKKIVHLVFRRFLI